MKNTHGGVLVKVTLFHGCFSRFSSFTNDTKSGAASQTVLNREFGGKDNIIGNDLRVIKVINKQKI